MRFWFGAYLRGIETRIEIPRPDPSLLSLEPTYEGLKLQFFLAVADLLRQVWSLPTRD